MLAAPISARCLLELFLLRSVVQGAVRENWKKRTFVFMNEADQFEVRCECASPRGWSMTPPRVNAHHGRLALHLRPPRPSHAQTMTAQRSM